MDGSTAISVIPPAYPTTSLSRRATSGAAAENGPAAEKSAVAGKVQQTEEFTPTERKEIEKLQRRDREVKAHELAHKASAGQYARGAANFDYKIGPDGKRYAVGGEVSIDISREADPQQTLEKAQVIRRAALALADPSGQDRRIASQAAVMAAEARQELLAERRASVEASTEGQSSDDEQSMITPAGRHAISQFKAVESASMAAREDPFDHFI